MKVVPRPSAYPDLQLRPDPEGWTRSFFYCDEIPGKLGERLAPFAPSTPSGRLGWDAFGAGSDAETEALCNRVNELILNGLTGLELLSFWRLRRVQPLQDRAHKLCQWSGLEDSSRIITVDLPTWQHNNWLRIREGFAGIWFPAQAGLEAYDLHHPAPWLFPQQD